MVSREMIAKAILVSTGVSIPRDSIATAALGGSHGQHAKVSLILKFSDLNKIILTLLNRPNEPDFPPKGTERYA